MKQNILTAAILFLVLVLCIVIIVSTERNTVEVEIFERIAPTCHEGSVHIRYGHKISELTDLQGNTQECE